MNFIKPKKLKKGDTIAVLSPSKCLPSIFPKIYESGIKTLKNLGLKIKEFPSTKKNAQYNYDNPKFRAKDINSAFSDPEIKGIFTSIGGDDSIRILQYIDTDIVLRNPKIFMGFSDISMLNVFFNQLGLVTLNGPSVMAGFSQWENLEKNFQDHIETILFENLDSYNYEKYDFFCHGYPDWSDEKNVGKTNKKIKNKGWTWIQGNEKVQGKLLGGCIEVFEFMKSTEFWPEEKFWQNKILFFETSEDKPSPFQIKCILRNYGIQGIFDKISAILIGRPMNYSDEEKKELDQIILQIVKTEFKNDKIPIITNMDFGHTDPQWILPLGISAEIDCKKKTFKLTENIYYEK